MTKAKASTDGVAEPAVQEVAAQVPAVQPPAPIEQPHGAVADASFPSQHVIYLAVVRNEIEAQQLRFQNGLEMLQAKINGAQTAHEDEMRMLKEEFDRKRQEKQDAHLSDVTRLKVQISDLKDVIETYGAALTQYDAIVDRAKKADEAAERAVT